MKIAVTGGTGTIGLAVIRALVKRGEKQEDITSFSRTEGRIAKAKQEFPQVNWRMWDVREGIRTEPDFFDLIIHTAAMKYVPECEAEPYRCYETNVDGTMRAFSLGAHKFILISTDKAVEPVSVMGASKMMAEAWTRWAGGIVVRLVNVMPSAGSVFEIWERQYKAQEPITITDPRMTRYFITPEEAADLVLLAMDVGCPDDTFVPAAESVMMGSLASMLVGEKYPRKITGARPGERTDELLMTVAELARAIPLAHSWLIRPKTDEPMKPRMKVLLSDKIKQTIHWGEHAG
jgi:UDP-glucose 4-epimerase